MSTHPSPILLLGSPQLRLVSAPVFDTKSKAAQAEFKKLRHTLEYFQETHGFGRAIAAPQTGIAKRFIAANIQGEALTMINPQIISYSQNTFTLWDNCMSFPDLLVRVERHCEISVQFSDETGKIHVMEHLDRGYSELLQHEIDHLDGILAVDRAIDKNSLTMRHAFETYPTHFASLVD